MNLADFQQAVLQEAERILRESVADARRVSRSRLIADGKIANDYVGYRMIELREWSAKTED